MSVSRQQKRAMRRKLVAKGITNETAESVIIALRKAETAKAREARAMVPGIAEDVYKRLQTEVEKMKAEFEAEKAEMEERIKYEAMGDAVLMVLAFEHIDRHHTGRWLRQWLQDFNEFGDDISASGEGMDAIKNILLEECGFDVVKEFAKCEELSNIRNEEKRRMLA